MPYSDRAYEAQVKKAKQGWAFYYRLMEAEHQTQVIYSERLIEVSTQEMPEHIKTEILDLLSQVKAKVDCPICLEVIPEGQIDITKCGHKFCKSCLLEVKRRPNPECSICRKKIWVAQ